jgi:hypothetical protein
MARYIHREPHLSVDELARRSRSTRDPVKRSRWHFLWLLARDLTAKVIASLTGYSAPTGQAAPHGGPFPLQKSNRRALADGHAFLR